MERLNKVLASSGISSRRKADELIRRGAVSVNGVVVTELGTKVNGKDIVMVKGKIIKKEEHVYYVMNKPTGYITSVKDEKKRKIVMDLIENADLVNRIYPVGRLDYDTAGVLLLTNDGEFLNKITNPENEIEKEYLARVEGIVNKIELTNLSKGVLLSTGYKTKPCTAGIVSIDRKNNSSLLNIIINEGKNRQVRLMCEAIGHNVKKLTRVRIDNITLEGIPRGCYRELKIHEVKQIFGR